MNLYLETSALLAWLLTEDRGEPARRALAQAERVITSELTLVESDRTFIAAVARGRIGEGQATDLSATLARLAAHWTVFSIGGSVLERARRAFPVEPIRVLDAIHLSSALEARRAVPDLLVLSFDKRAREARSENS